MIVEDVKNYPQIFPDWYKNTTQQSHVAEFDCKYVELKINIGKIKHQKMNSKLEQSKIKECSALMDKLSDTFA